MFVMKYECFGEPDMFVYEWGLFSGLRRRSACPISSLAFVHINICVEILFFLFFTIYGSIGVASRLLNL